MPQLQSKRPSEQDTMTLFYKWIIGGLVSLLMVFGTTYINSVQTRIDMQGKEIMGHEQRITTLEESKRNQEALLIDIKNAVDKIRDAVAGQR